MTRVQQLEQLPMKISSWKPWGLFSRGGLCAQNHQALPMPDTTPAPPTWFSGTKAAGATTKSSILNCSPASTVQVKQSKKGRGRGIMHLEMVRCHSTVKILLWQGLRPLPAAWGPDSRPQGSPSGSLLLTAACTPLAGWVLSWG